MLWLHDRHTGQRMLLLHLTKIKTQEIDRQSRPVRPGTLAAHFLGGGSPQLMDDIQAPDAATSPFRESLQRNGDRAALGVPVSAGGKCIGVIVVRHPAPRAFGPAGLTLLGALGTQAGAIVERAQAEDARRRAEQALRESEARYRSQYKSLPVASSTWQQQGDDPVLIDFNEMARTVTRGGMDRLLGVRSREWHAATPQIWQCMQQCFAEQRPLSLETDYVYRTTGEQRHLLMTFAFAPPDMVVSHALDLTTRVELENERATRARLDGALLVARTVAHEINNALVPVVGFTELLSLRPAVKMDPVARRYLTLMEEAAASMTEKVRRLQRIIRLEETTEHLGPDQPILDIARSTAPLDDDG